jgi:hypothetical protein
MTKFDIDALLAFHRRVFGDARMEGEGGGNGEGKPTGEGEDGGDGFKPIASQADLDRIVTDRLTRERAKFKDYDDLKAKASELDKLKESQQTDTEKAVSAARKEAEEAVRTEVRRERVLDRVEVLAAKDFADAEDARLRLAGRADEFLTKDGQIDSDAVKAALSTLLKDKPHLAAKGGPKGDVGQGSRPDPPKDSGTGRARLAAAYAAKK